MSELELASLILAGEFALISWLILFLFLRRQHQRQREDHVHAGAVREHIEAHELTHREALTRLFENTYGLTGEALSDKVNEYLARERAFYNVMLNLYLNRDGAKLKEIPAELAKVVKPWAEIAEMPQAGMVSASAVLHLEDEKTQLAKELEQTKETLEQLMQEYMAAFKKDQQETAAPEASAPPPTEPAAQIAEAVDLDDIDVDLETAPVDAQTPAPEPETPSVPVETMAEPAEERLDPEDIDAMLRALAAEMTQGQPSEPAEARPTQPPAERPPLVEELELSPQETEQQRARDELDSLADLFDLDAPSQEPPNR